jgi:nitrite reductase/ring-hydroxylating ferredoxin subunit
MVGSQQTQSPVLCRVEDLSDNQGKEAMLPGPEGLRYFMVFLCDGEVRAWLNTCPHQGRSLSWAPDQFLFDPSGRLVCPHHGAVFEIATGACVSGPCLGASLTPVPVRVEEGEVILEGGEVVGW